MDCGFGKIVLLIGGNHRYLTGSGSEGIRVVGDGEGESCIEIRRGEL